MKTILVVDDEPPIRRLLRTSLGAQGYRVLEAETGWAALDLLERLVGIPYFLTPQYLAIDPNFAPLRGNPRFERLVKGAATQAP